MYPSVHTEAEKNNDFTTISADECHELRRATELGWSIDELADGYDLPSETVLFHVCGDCQHYPW
jgi:hypothetical protein